MSKQKTDEGRALFVKRIPTALMMRLKNYAYKKRISARDVVIRALSAYLSFDKEETTDERPRKRA